MGESTTELAKSGGGLMLPGQVTPTALVLPDGLTFEAWEKVGQTLDRIEAGFHWWRGDWLLYGERRYGETYAQALDPEKGRYETLRKEVWVASRIEPGRRLPVLSWSHHQAVASLEPEQQDVFLARAAEQGWPRRELKRHIREWRALTPVETGNRLPVSTGVNDDQADGELGFLKDGMQREEPEAEETPPPPRRRVALAAADEREIYERVKAGETYASIAEDYDVDEDRIGTIARQLRAAEERVPDPVIAAIPLPSGQVWRCIVIDPPWPMEKIEREERPDQGRLLDYPVMPVPDMVTTAPVDKLADPEGCHVYLWTTQRFLPNAFWLFSRWGVRYQCTLTWVKPTGITPYTWMYNTEHVLFGRIGSLPLERMGLKLSFEAPVTKHSAKPDIFYERVVAASPGPRLEMFARMAREGFEVWGNEVASVAAEEAAGGE